MNDSSRFRAIRWGAAWFFSLLMLCLIPPQAMSDDGVRGVTATDLYAFRWIGDPQISPDGSRSVFVEVSVDEKREDYRANLAWLDVSANANVRPLTSGERDTMPRWSPDGRHIAFLRPTATGDQSRPQVHLLPLSGGEARAVTSLPQGVSEFAWSPDGRSLAVVGRELRADIPENDDAAGVRVITTALFRNDGSGYRDNTLQQQLWRVDLAPDGQAGAEPLKLTDDLCGKRGLVWTPDGSAIAYQASCNPEPYLATRSTRLVQVPKDGGPPGTLLDFAGSLSGWRFSPDGQQIAFVGSPLRSPVTAYSQGSVYIAGAADAGEVRALTQEGDLDFASGLAGDQAAPIGGGPASLAWDPDGRSVLVQAARHGELNIYRVGLADGQVQPVTSGRQSVSAFSLSNDGEKLLYLRSDQTVMEDLWLIPARAGEARQLTSLNAPLFAEVAMPEPEAFWYESFDGTRVQGWIVKPPGFRPGRKYPMILQVHGGPHAAYGEVFTHEFQFLAARGYVVVYTNPRGSTSYGQVFANAIQYAYPGEDHLDLMAAVDAVLARGYVDPEKVGITGGSGGGVLTNWAISHTDRFAAAVSQRSIADWAAFWYSSDIVGFQEGGFFPKPPWLIPEQYLARSPISRAHLVKTPTMFVEGEADYRTPPTAGGEAMFRALKYHRVPTVMVRFPDEPHGLSRMGKPRYRTERLRHIVNWFDIYLQGAPADEYQVR